MTAGGSPAGQEPLVSVIVPVFNAEKFLLKTLSSIRRQTYRNLEIILVDDGSSDRSLEICREASKEDDRIKVLTKENGGAGSARNMGILAAQGALIGFADSDDLLYPDMYEKLVAGYLQAEEELKKPGKTDASPAADAKKAPSGKPFLVQIGREEIDEGGKHLQDAVTPPASPEWIGASDFARSLLLYTGDSSMCTKLTPAGLLRENLFEEKTLGEDFGLLMRLCGRIAGVVNLPSTGYRVVHRAGSATRRKNAASFSKAYVDIVRQSDKVEKEIVPEHPELSDAAKAFALIERLDYLLHVPVRDMNRQNLFYTEVCGYLRRNFRVMCGSRLIGAKKKLYLVLLTAAPVTVRKAHLLLRGRKMAKEKMTR